MTRLLILTTTPLERDPRARRATTAARQAGVDVEELHPAERRRHAAMGRFVARESGAVSRELFGIARLVRLLLGTARLAVNGRSLRFDVLHANDLDTLPAGWLLARRRGARLVYDAHELYSGFELDPPRLWARLSLSLEGALARRADAIVTVSEPIAAELTQRLRLARPPLLVLNCPPLTKVDVESRPGVAVRAIYQAAAGPGRLLEDIADAACEAPEIEFTVRLLGGGAGHLPGVVVEPPVPPDRLVEALVPFDIGLVIDRPQTDNARLALPNKLFEYLMAGLAVAVPRAEAMASLVEQHRIGLVYDPGGLGTALAQLAADRDEVDAMRRRARELAETRFNAEAQRPALQRAWGL